MGISISYIILVININMLSMMLTQGQGQGELLPCKTGRYNSGFIMAWRQYLLEYQ